jgi:RIO kinase 1
MPRINLTDLQDGEFDPSDRRTARGGPLHKAGIKYKSEHEVLDEIIQYGGNEPVAADSVFTPTFTSSRHERDWILNFLGPFYEEEYLTDVLCQVRGGKEATVYCCKAHPTTGLDLIAAKVYRPRAFRKLRNDSQYRQGRQILDAFGKVVRDQRYLVAIRKKTSVGKELIHASWLQHEYRTLQILQAAGADVPIPITQGNNTILMQYLGEVDAPAPTLNTVTLTQKQARDLFDRLVHNLELMLSTNCIHGDLSAYNVLYWEGNATIIDFPQAIHPAENRDAFAIFQRDVTRLCQYFHRYRIQTRPARLAQELWDRYIHLEPEILEEVEE